MSSDDIRVVLVDPAGTELGSHPITFSAPLRVGQEVWFVLGGSERLCRVLREPAGEGGERKAVHVIEIQLRCPFCRAALLATQGPTGVGRDEHGDFATCRECGRRVAMQRIPTTPPGGPTRLRVASAQER